MTKKEPAQFCPANKHEWRNWLKINHQNEDAVWLIMYKKASPKHNLNWSAAVDEALCFGWIDSTKRPIDEEKFMQFFSKRKNTSTWSKINKEKVARLGEKGLMADAGKRMIAIAKENGNWTILDSVEALVVPADLEAKLAAFDGAKEFFESLSKSAKKGLLHWVVMAKRAETRQKRNEEIASNASQKMKPKALR
jgi:uncharacterized protein YdeI (YjbR/CyaY-like superfamily)